MNFKVFGDKVIFREVKEDEDTSMLQKTASGFFIPQQVTEAAKSQRRNFTGEVVFAGEACKFVKIGDHVSYDQYGVATFNHGTEVLLIARENDLIGKYVE